MCLIHSFANRVQPIHLPEAAIKRCSQEKVSKNMQQIYRITPMPKCDFNKFALQLYWNRTSAWVLSCKFTAYFQNIFLQNTSGQLFLICITNQLTVFYKKRILVLNVLRQNTLIAGFLQMKSITKRRIQNPGKSFHHRCLRCF